VQRRLRVGPVGDRSEVEADHVAVAVVRALREPRPGPTGSPDMSDEVAARRIAGRIRRSATAGIVGEAGGALDADTDAAIRRAAGRGRPLDDRVRRRMERGFGADLSAVRVHADATADDLSRRIQAQAFTTGNDIFFARQQYDPSSSRGEHLLAHELTHVVQQGATGGVRRSTVIRRVPAAFVGERTRLEQDPRTTPNAFTNFFGLDSWGTLLDSVDQYSRVKEDAIALRERRMGVLVTNVTSWRQDYAKSVSAHKNDASDDARSAEVSDTGALGSKIVRERRELGDVKGTLAVQGAGPALSPEPGATKKHGATATLNKDVIASYDRKLTESAGLPLPSGSACDVFAQYQVEGSALVSVVSPLQGKITVWVPLDALTIGGAARVESAVPTGPLPRSKTPAPPVEHFLAGMQHHDIAESTPLFPHPPKIDDVQQGGLGDCYLHAAVLSVVHRNPADIVAMMKDEGGTVTVRLYDVTTGPPKTFTPRLVRLKKSAVWTEYERREKGVAKGPVFYESYAKGALWVKMLEKAYAAAGMSGLGAALVGAPSYGEIASGFTSTAMEHLLGQEADISFVAMQTGVGVNAALLPTGVLRLPWSSAEQSAYDLAKAATEDKEAAYASLVSFDILHDVAAVDAWMNFVAKVDIEAKVRVLASKGSADYRKGEIRLDDFITLFREEHLEERLAKPVNDWLAAKRLYPGRRGTGKYTANQLALFGRIRTLLNSGGYAGVATKSEVGRTVGGTGHSGGESKTKGIAGGHAYAVLGFKPDKDPSELQPGELVMIRLRNPWGSYGRQYEARQGDKLKVKKAVPTGDAATDTAATEKIHSDTPGGDFDVELSDLTKRFAWLDSSAARR
jgi:hypothetical protein